ncbi:MAG: hypothetical protein RIR53_1628 [Bacteroidota bacterium]
MSHVFGTIHLADTAAFRQRDTVLKILDASRVHVSELNLDSVLTGMRPEILLLPAGTLYDIYDSASVSMICDRLTAVNAILAKACIRLKPGAIMMLVSMGSFERSAPTSIDEFLWARAKVGKLERRGLETLAEQIGIMDSIPAGLVLEQIRSTDSLEEDIAELRSAYVREDLLGLDSLAQSDVTVPAETMQMLNDRRNERMVERMIPMIESGGAFIAVGALHLTGRSSIIDLLRGRGYAVTPVLGGTRRSWLESGPKR